MKKVIAMLLAVLLLATALTACGSLSREKQTDFTALRHSRHLIIQIGRAHV